MYFAFALENFPPIASKIITVDKTDTLMNVLTEDLSDEKCRLLSSKNIKGQRITIRLNNVDKSKVPDILINVLSHNDQSINLSPMFEWHRGTENNTYIFTSNSTYSKKEREILDFPVRQLINTIKLSRDDIQSEIKNTNHMSSIAFIVDNKSVLYKSISKLSDSQIEAMVHGKSVDVSSLIPQSNINFYKNMWNAMIEKSGGSASSQIRQIPFSKPVLRLEKGDEDGVCFNLVVHGALDAPAPEGVIWNNTGITIDPYLYQDEPDSPAYRHTKWLENIPNDKVLDLSEMFSKDSKIDLTNSGEVLRYIANKSNINLICEQFKFKDINSQRPVDYRFPLKKGTLRDIFKLLWENLNLKCSIKDDIYYVWSPKWAFERRKDVSDEDIEKYKKIYKYNSGFTISNLKEIAAKFNDYQIRNTISPELNLTTFDKANFSKTSLAMLRFLSHCPDEILTRAQQSPTPLSNNPMYGGIEWSAIPNWLRSELDISSGQDGKTLEPKIEFTFQDITYAQGKLFLNRRVEDGLLTERAMLGMRRQDGEQIFGASIITRTKVPQTKRS